MTEPVVQRYTITLPERKITTWPLMLAMIMTLVGVGFGYVLHSPVSVARLPPQTNGTTEAQLAQLLATNTPWPTSTNSATATIDHSTPVPTRTPAIKDLVGFCDDVGDLTPCIPYGTKIPVPPTATPTVTPIPFCKQSDYQTDTEYVCRKPVTVYRRPWKTFAPLV